MWETELGLEVHVSDCYVHLLALLEFGPLGGGDWCDGEVLYRECCSSCACQRIANAIGVRKAQHCRKCRVSRDKCHCFKPGLAVSTEVQWVNRSKPGSSLSLAVNGQLIK